MNWMPRPRLFLSYARTDRDFADRLEEHLQGAECDVWLDRNELLTGDNFVEGLKRELSRCHGLVFLLTRASAASSWCMAELQRAAALQLPIFIVRRESEAILPEAADRMLRDIQRLDWFTDAPPALAEHLRAARKRRWRLAFRRIAFASTMTFALLGIVYWSIANINAWQQDRARMALLAELRAGSRPLFRSEIDYKLRRFKSDTELPVQMAALASDTSASPIARFNAWQTQAAASEWQPAEWRTVVPSLEWNNGRVNNILWSNTTYPEGSIRGLEARRVRMAGLVFGAGPDAQRVGMSWIDTRIIDSDIWFLRLDGTQLIEVEFKNCKFRGAQLDLSGFAGVRFVSENQNPGFITADIGVFEDSLIAQHHTLPGPGVMDLGQPEQEISFVGIQFLRTRFEGEFKAEWFRDNHFEDCVFATSMTQASLEAQGNRVESSIWTAPRSSQ